VAIFGHVTALEYDPTSSYSQGVYSMTRTKAWSCQSPITTCNFLSKVEETYPTPARDRQDRMTDTSDSVYRSKHKLQDPLMHITTPVRSVCTPFSCIECGLPSAARVGIIDKRDMYDQT
jgi:hypothetical protein